MDNLIYTDKPKESIYTRHQGTKERVRRLMKMKNISKEEALKIVQRNIAKAEGKP